MRRFAQARTVVAAAVSALVLSVGGIGAGLAPASADVAAPVDSTDPNYVWRPDIVSKALA